MTLWKQGKRRADQVHNCCSTTIDPREGFMKLVSDDRAQPVEETKPIMIDATGWQLRIGTQLNPEGESSLAALLISNQEVFAWSTGDITGLDPTLICHKLSVNTNVMPIAQRKRKMGEEKRKVVKIETDRLLEVKFIREVKYPTWLANVVMGKKANRKWRMCTDYTDLNKHCPKDAHPLPNIDLLVDRASGFKVLSLMDVFSGYNQIPMHPVDEENTAFMTEHSNYCYRTMPFGLKNAGATYQRLMDKIFAEQVRRNVEIYVDDMVVKSISEEGHLADLQEAFEAVRKHNLKLNPEKCSFGIQSGKFLGFMLTDRGIEANPDKCKAIREMKSPAGVKEVQRLTGRRSEERRV